MRTKPIFFCSILASFLFNVILLFIFHDHIRFSLVSLIPLFILLAELYRGIYAFIFRNRGNYLHTYRLSLFSGAFFGRDNPFTEAQRKEFFWQFLIFGIAFPFYIPCVFFSANFVEPSLITVMVLFIGIRVGCAVYKMVELSQSAKQKRIVEKKQEKERVEQEKRESMGYFK